MKACQDPTSKLSHMALGWNFRIGRWGGMNRVRFDLAIVISRSDVVGLLILR